RIKLIMAFGAGGAADRLPLAVGEPGKVRYQRLVGTLRIAHPDPEQGMAFDQRIDLHGDARHDAALMRIEDAGAGAVGPQALIRALQSAIDDPAVAQGREAVRTAAAYGLGDALAV